MITRYMAMLYAKDIAAGIEEVVLGRVGAEIHEILVYGSVADPRRPWVNDIDMMVLANDSLAAHFPPPEKPDDWYGMLKGNLRRLIVDVCGWQLEDFSGIMRIPCDLHVFPLRLLTDAKVRQEIIRCHRDPMFIHNALARILRYDARRGSLDPTTLKYLEEKYYGTMLQ